MTARGTIALLGVLSLLALYVWLGELRSLSGPPTPDSRAPTGPAQGASAEPRKPPVRGPGLVPDAPRTKTLTLTKKGRTVTLERTAGGWRPTGRGHLSGPDAADVEDFLHNLSEIGEIMTVDESPQTLGDYGLDEPERVLVLGLPGQQERRLEIGHRNPAWTASYARFADKRQVILIGALLVSQFDRVYRRLAESSGGKDAGVP